MALRVLIVDDEPMIRSLLQQIIKIHAGVQVDIEIIVAVNVAEALVASEKGPFDVVFCDTDLPDGTGFQLFEPLTKIAPRLFMAMSGYSGNRRAWQAIFTSTEYANGRFLSKPFVVDEIFTLLASL